MSLLYICFAAQFVGFPPIALSHILPFSFPLRAIETSNVNTSFVTHHSTYNFMSSSFKSDVALLSLYHRLLLLLLQLRYLSVCSANTIDDLLPLTKCLFLLFLIFSPFNLSRNYSFIHFCNVKNSLV